jgi:phospholipase C
MIAAAWTVPQTARADGNLQHVNHIIIVMQENHSFDNYFGALPYAPASPYHRGPCAAGDHAYVDGLSCQRNPVNGKYVCHNSNRDDNNGKKVSAFHSTDYCVDTDLDHSWFGVHRELNFADPNGALMASPMDGFVLQNDSSNQPDNGVETRTDDETMSYQTFVAQAINAVRNGPNWGDSIIFVTYDEHGGFFDTCRATCGVAGWSAESGRHQPRAVCRQVESAGERDAQWWPELRRE